MFWGLIMEPIKRYSQLVERSFHLSMASLDVTGANDQPVQVMLCYENRNYLLCTLKKGAIFQVPLDLNFQEGTKIAFTCNGFGHVHLTGYLTLDEDLDFGDLEEEEDEEEAPQLVKPKRKAVESPPKASKKLKKQVNDDEDSSEDDENMDAESDSDDEDQTKLVEADDDDEDESEDDSDDEEEDEDSEEEPEEEVSKSKQKHKQNQKAQNQIGKKHEKQKLVNGKDAQHDLSKQKKNKPEQQQENAQQPKRRTVEGGVVIEDIVVGHGAPAKLGRAVSVYYVGRLKDGKKFDETKQGDGFKFHLGKGEVIKGWDVGISGMKIGGKRRLTIPAPMGYGKKGSPPVIPGNSTLIFEVELKKVH